MHSVALFLLRLLHLDFLHARCGPNSVSLSLTAYRGAAVQKIDVGAEKRRKRKRGVDVTQMVFTNRAKTPAHTTRYPSGESMMMVKGEEEEMKGRI